MEEYEEKGIPVYPTLIASCAATIAALLIAGGLGTPWLWFVAGLIAMLFAIGSLVVRSMHREVMSRRWGLDILRGWEKTLLIPALVLYPASAALGAADMTRGLWSMMPSWTLIVGFFLLATGYVLVIQALQADAPHAPQHYGEQPRPDADKGAYDILRHPIALGAILLGLSLPFLLHSAVALIPAGLQTILLVAYVSREDNWRFHEYEWYYEYTRKTPYRLIPLIW